MALKAIFFDLDDTLLWDERSVEEAFRETCAEAAKRVSLDPQQLENAVRAEARKLYESYGTFPFTKMIGINPFEALWANFSEGHHEQFRKLEQLAPVYRVEAWTRGLRALGIENRELGQLLADKFPAERRKRPLAYEETFRVLDALKPKYKLLMLTNGAPDLQKEKIAGFPQLAAYFERIVISGEFGEGKPAASIFHYALKQLGVEAHEAIMIGDKLTSDILGSSRAGIKNAWINRNGKTRSDEIVPDYEIQHLEQLHDLIQTL